MAPNLPVNSSVRGDPTNFGVDPNGDAINLTADGTYNRGFTASLGRQGINGWIWGLIALDAKHYSIPDGSYYSRADIIKEILKLQLSDGGLRLQAVALIQISPLWPYSLWRHIIRVDHPIPTH